ncbi:MAG TPA: DUF2267 domain-containing protein [Bradyrhizobium sp.]|nr:DUF2267 domain-containing protein [Stellaceae bacterium]HUO00212.1 DUF2267 domain-containing protein [Bradyrhizobium sp.]
MSNAPILDTSIQRAHEWLHDVGRGLGFDNEHAEYAALRATLHALRDRLPVELVAHFGAGLPTMIRGIYYDGWHPSAARLREAHTEDFCKSMQRELHGHHELQNTEQVAIAVMGAMHERMDTGQIDHIVDALPKQVRDLWHVARQ